MRYIIIWLSLFDKYTERWADSQRPRANIDKLFCKQNKVDKKDWVGNNSM